MQLIDFIVNQYQFDDRTETLIQTYFTQLQVWNIITCQQALNQLQGNTIINSSDTDVFIIPLMGSERINANIF